MPKAHFVNHAWRDDHLPAKIWLVMRLTSILILAACLQVSAKGLTQTLTLKETNVSLKQVFQKIEKQTGYTFIYKPEVVANAKKVTIHVSNGTLEQVLQLCFKDQSLSYKIFDKIIAVQPKVKQESHAELDSESVPPINIRGRIVNEKGESVVASVQVKGTNKGVTTNDDGVFELKGVEDDAVLVVSGVSIEAFEVQVNGRSELTLSARMKMIKGEQIIINTGYQNMKPERFVGAASGIDSTQYNRRVGMNIIDRLDGITPGVVFDKKQGNKIQIRGISTLEGIPGSSSSPLIILDNFPYYGNLNLLNPNDVLDISILKDAAAASIWGTQAGNGVIVITTKKGKPNQPLRISASSNVSVYAEPDLFYYPRMSSGEFINVEQYLFNKGFYNAALANTTTYPVISPAVELFAKRRAGSITAADSATQINSLMQFDLRNDLKRYVYQRQVNQQHYLSLSGGSSFMSYSFSAGYNHTRPNIQGSKTDNQYTLSTVNTFYPARNLVFEAALNYSKTEAGNASFSLPKVYPYARLADDNGNALALPNTYRLGYIDTIGRGKLLDWHYRPLDEIKNADNITNIQLYRINFKISYKITSWLKAEALYQNFQQGSSGRDYYSPETYLARNEINRFTQITGTTVTRRIPLGGILNLGNTSLRSNNARGQISIDKRWNGKHEISSIIAGEVSDAKISSNSARYYGFDAVLSTHVSSLDYVTSFPTLPSGTDRIGAGGAVSDNGQVNRIASVLGNISYTYKNTYTVYGSARRDGANIFGVNTNNKWKPLWSVGGNWNVFNEKFFKISWLPYLRVRASYGYTGNANNQFSGVSTILYSTTATQYTNLTYAQVGNPPNPDLRWEEVRIANLGVDFKLLKGRLSGSFDVYSKKSKDVISPIPFDPSTGVDLFTVNSASLKGKGFEASISSQNVTGQWYWDTRFAISYAKSIVAKVYDSKVKAGDFIVYGVNQSEGKLAYGVVSYRWGGLDAATGDPQGILNKQVSKNYTAIFNDSVDNQVFHGSAIPLYSGYLGNTFGWKGLSLSANITYRFAYYFRKPTISYNSLFNSWEAHSDYSLRWQKPGDENHTTVPSLVYPANANRDLFYQYSEVNVLKGDNIKLQDLRLQYTVDKKTLKKLPLKDIQLFVYANNLNLILWKANNEGYDPDFTGGRVSALTPVPKSLTIGVNINF